MVMSYVFLLSTCLIRCTEESSLSSLADVQVPGTSGVLGQGAEEQKGETARLVSIDVATVYHADTVELPSCSLIKSCLCTAAASQKLQNWILASQKRLCFCRLHLLVQWP